MATLVIICAFVPAAGFQPLAGALRGLAPRTRIQTGPGARMRPAVVAPLGLSMSSGAVDPVKRPINKLRFIQVSPPPPLLEKIPLSD